MSEYKEFMDGTSSLSSSAVEDLNDFAKEHEVRILGYQVVGNEQRGFDRTYILVEVIK